MKYLFILLFSTNGLASQEDIAIQMTTKALYIQYGIDRMVNYQINQLKHYIPKKYEKILTYSAQSVNLITQKSIYYKWEF